MAQPTPGPWVAQPGTTTGQEVVAPSAPKTRRVIARCGGADREANARLIAAAPDLLDVAKGLRQHLALFCGPDDAVAAEVFRIADAAIAKAETP